MKTVATVCRLLVAGAACLLNASCDELRKLEYGMDHCCCVNLVSGHTKWATTRDCNNSQNWACATSGNQCDSPPPKSEIDKVDSVWKLTAVHRSMQSRFWLMAGTQPGQSKPPDDPTECEEQCNSGRTFCLRVGVDVASNLVDKVGNTREMLEDKTRSRITRAELANVYGQDDKECPRGDTILGSANFSNTGKSECMIQTDVSTQAASMPIKISIPTVLSGSRRTAPGDLVLTFPNTKHAPRLTLGDSAYDRDYGGSVSRVHASKDRAIISTSNGCIALAIDNSNR
jgi:hypothetical protein